MPWSSLSSGDVPFLRLEQVWCELRGYTGRQFQDDQMFAIQGEYRLEITKRIGTVAFAGVGAVMPSFNRLLPSTNPLPSGGVGFRYVVAEKKPHRVPIRCRVGPRGQPVLSDRRRSVLNPAA